MIKDKIFYVLGLAIIVGNVFIQPYDGTYMMKEAAFIRTKYKAQKIYLSSETKIIMKKECEVEDEISALNNHKDTASLVTYQIDSINNRIDVLNDFVKRSYSILHKDIKRFTKDRMELIGGFYYKQNINTAYYYGFFAIGMFFLIYGKERTIKETNNDKQKQ